MPAFQEAQHALPLRQGKWKQDLHLPDHLIPVHLPGFKDSNQQEKRPTGRRLKEILAIAGIPQQGVSKVHPIIKG